MMMMMSVIIIMTYLESWWTDKVHPDERNAPGRPVVS